MTRRARTLLPLASAACLALLACQKDDAVSVILPPAPVTLDPQSVRITVGDTAFVSVTSYVPDAHLVAWSASHADIVTVNAVTPTRLLVRAVGVGSDAISLSIAIDGQIYTTGVPVTVVAASH